MFPNNQPQKTSLLLVDGLEKSVEKIGRLDNKAIISKRQSVDNIDLPQEFQLSWTSALCST